jgi:hypothetical protein
MQFAHRYIPIYLLHVSEFLLEEDVHLVQLSYTTTKRETINNLLLRMNNHIRLVDDHTKMVEVKSKAHVIRKAKHEIF